MDKYQEENKARSRRGGHNRHAKSFEDTIVNVETAGQLLKKHYSIVRQEAQEGKLPVHSWVGKTPYFRAGDLMALAAP